MRAKNIEPNKSRWRSQTIVVAKQPLRFGTELNARCCRKCRGRPSAAGRRLRQNRRRHVRRPPRRADRDRAERAGARAQDHRPRRSARRCRRWCKPGHEGGDHPRQRRRRRRRLRAAGRPRRRRAHAPDRKGSATTEVVLQNTRVLAVDQIADERAAKAVGGQVGHARSRRQSRHRKSGSRPRSAACRCCCARRAKPPKCKTRKVTLKDLGTDEPVGTEKSATATVVVTRAAAKQEYTVPVEGSNGALADDGDGGKWPGKPGLGIK